MSLQPRGGNEEKPKPFSLSKLRAETEDPFGKVRLAFFAFFTISTSVGFLFTLPRLAASMAGVKSAAPPSGNVFMDLAINGGCFALFAYLTSFELDMSTKRENAKEEAGLLSRLTVWVQDGEGEEELRRLSDMRRDRESRARRPVLCIGGKDYLDEVLATASKQAQAVDRADLLIVPVLSDPALDRSSLAAAARDLRYVALPPEDGPNEESADWKMLVERQLELVRSQGMDEDKGQVIIIKKDGRVATRFLGVPDWTALSGEINGRATMGLDTESI